MKEKKLLRCICCGAFTLRRFKGWWIHKHCLEELKERLLLIKHRLPSLQYTVLFGDSELLTRAIHALLSGRPNEMQDIRDEIKGKAWKLLEAEYGKPSWIKQ